MAATATFSHPALDYDTDARSRDRAEQQELGVGGPGARLAAVKAKRTIEPTPRRCWRPSSYRDRAEAAGRNVDRVVATYEAGWSGFWLARWLTTHGIEMHVIQPSSVPVDRRARRAKSDGIDAELLLRTLLAWLRGEPRVCSMVPIPAEADEDARRCVRERSGAGRRSGRPREPNRRCSGDLGRATNIIRSFGIDAQRLDELRTAPRRAIPTECSGQNRPYAR